MATMVIVVYSHRSDHKLTFLFGTILNNGHDRNFLKLLSTPYKIKIYIGPHVQEACFLHQGNAIFVGKFGICISHTCRKQSFVEEVSRQI